MITGGATRWPSTMSILSAPIPSHTTPNSVAYCTARTHSYIINKDIPESKFLRESSLLAATHSTDRPLEQFT